MDDLKLVRRTAFAKELGLARQTLIDWEKDPALNFPAPALITGRGRSKIKYWLLADVRHWLNSRDAA